MLGKVWYFETSRSNCITSWKLFSVLSKPTVYKQFRIFWETQWHQWNSLNNRNSFQVRRKGKKNFQNILKFLSNTDQNQFILIIFIWKRSNKHLSVWILIVGLKTLTFPVFTFFKTPLSITDSTTCCAIRLRIVPSRKFLNLFVRKRNNKSLFPGYGDETNYL